MQLNIVANITCRIKQKHKIKAFRLTSTERAHALWEMNSNKMYYLGE